MNSIILDETNRVQGHPLARWHAAVARRHIIPAKFVALGDSFTWGLGASTFAHRFVDQLASKLQAAYPSGIPGYEQKVAELSASPSTLPGVAGYNGGFGGATTLTYASSAHLYGIGVIQPALVLHQVGFNDFRIDKRIPSEYGKNLAAAVDAVSGIVPNASQVLTHTSRPFDCPTVIWDAYGQQMKRVAATRPNVLFVDMSSIFERVNYVSGDPYGLNSDTIHPTDAGHALIAEQLAQAMNITPSFTDTKLVLKDTFTRPNSATLGSADEPNGALWRADAGTFGVQNNKAVATSTNAIASIETGLKDLDVSAVVSFDQGAPFPGLLFRLSASNNWMGLFANQTYAAAVLYKNTAGTLVSLAAPLKGFSDGQHHLRVVAQGSRIDCYVNGAITIQYTLTAAELTAFGNNTRVGFWENSGITASPGSGFWGLAVRRA